MKKILAVLFAVLLCLSMVAVAETAANAFEVTQDETCVETNLGDGRAVTRLPADWVAIEAEYSDESSKLLGAYANPEGTAMIIVTETRIEGASDAATLCEEAAAAGLTGELNTYNANSYAEITAVGADDHIVRMANYFADESTIIAFTFSYANDAKDAMQAVVEQALASLTVQ